MELLVKGFSSVTHVLSEWHTNKKDPAVMRAGTRQQWDVIEGRPDFYMPGTMEGWLSKDTIRPMIPGRTHASGRYPLFRVRVPSISYGMKSLVDQPTKVWPACGETIAKRDDNYEVPKKTKPDDEVMAAFYIDYSALPHWAKTALLLTGNVTLNEVDARVAIKHKFDQQMVNRLFVEFSVNG